MSLRQDANQLPEDSKRGTAGRGWAAIRGVLLSRRFWLWLAVVCFVVQMVLNFFWVLTWFDEANYAYKGYLAVKGIYAMYADGGPWFEYMPLAFLVPGVVQAVVGPNAYVHRLLPIFFAALLLLGVYRPTDRLGGARAALIATWLLVWSVVSLPSDFAGTPYSVVWLAVS